VSETLFATDASATAHNGEVILVDVGDTEYALAPSTARAFVDDLAAAVDDLNSTEPPEAEAAAKEFLERVDADSEEAPVPRERNPDAEWIMGLIGEDERLAQIPITYGCSECDFESETKAGVRRHQGMMHDGPATVITSGDTDDEDDDTTPPLDERILEVLDEHGELPSSEIKLLVETSSSQYYDALSTLRDAGRVESREDPDDGRRNLYRLAGTEVHTLEGDGSHDTSEEPHEDAETEEADDDVDEPDDGESYPKECSCGVMLHGGLEEAIHRTEEHDTPQSSTGYLEPGEFERTVEKANSPQDVADALDWGVERVLRALAIYGLDDLLVDPDRSLADINDFEFDGVAEQETAADGGATATAEPATEEEIESDWTAGENIDADPDATGPRRICQNCGTSISAQYVKVYEPDGVEQPRACPNCDDVVREGDGTIRESRT